MKLAVFIDYDNLEKRHKTSGILDVVTKALLQTPNLSPPGRGTCDVRIYGGWYEGPTMTKLAQDLSVEIQREFPAIVRLHGVGSAIIVFTATAELAVAMLEEPGHHLFDTYRKKARPTNLRVQKPENVGCTDAFCPLPLAKKMLKTGMCPNETCAVTSDDLVYRHEQKIVDTMLTCDMLFAPTLAYQHLILVSGDDDFLPPLRTMLLRGTQVVRFHPRPNRIQKPILNYGRQLPEIDL
jgi:uncharacterized LabA/DUF88 family protein